MRFFCITFTWSTGLSKNNKWKIIFSCFKRINIKEICVFVCFFFFLRSDRPMQNAHNFLAHSNMYKLIQVGRITVVTNRIVYTVVVTKLCNSYSYSRRTETA